MNKRYFSAGSLLPRVPRLSFALEGVIHRETIVDVLSYLDTCKKSGFLLIDAPGPFGGIGIERGKISYAATPYSFGRNAVFHILNLEQGYFRFGQGSSGRKFNCSLSITETLMLWSQLHDELRRYSHPNHAPEHYRGPS